MKKKEIYHIGFKHSIDDVRIFEKECTSLAKRDDLIVHYVVSDINSEITEDKKNGVFRHVLESHPKRVIRQLLYIRDIKKLLSDKSPDLIHIHEAPLLMIAMWGKRHGAKVIFDSHEDYYYQYSVGHGKLFAMIYKAYEKFICKRIDAVIFPCRMLERQPFDYPVKRMVYIDNHPIVRDILPTNETKDENNEFIACYTGTLSINRGVYNIIKAWHKAGIKGIIAGKFGSEEDKKTIENLPEYNTVEYLGLLPANKVEEVYRRASVGMATLLDKGQYHKTCNLPTKIGEYMIAGVPSIIYHTEYIDGFLDRYRFGIAVDPENIHEIVDAIEYIKNNPEERRKMIDEGYRAVNNEVNWGTQEKKLFDLYDEIMADD